MTQTNPLRLMIDYCLIDRRIMLALKTLETIEVKSTIECGYAQNESDEVLINEGTVEQNRLLLTTDRKTINRNRYKPCTHGGVILLSHRRLDADNILASIKAFIQSSKGNLAINHFTHLRPDSAKIYTHKDPVEVRF